MTMKVTKLLFAISRLPKSSILKTERELVIKAPWGNISALSWGEPSNPPVLMCQGKQDSCSSFRPLVKFLPDSYYYVSIDLPGNGRSTQYPLGTRLVAVDFLPPIARVRDHFKWEKFDFIGHSLGALLGKYHDILYPGEISRLVELDPEPAYLPYKKDFKFWAETYLTNFYGDDSYDRLNSGPETAPRYTYDEIRQKLMKARGLTEETVEHVLERCVEPAGDGLYRITFDQRMKAMRQLPYTLSALHEQYTFSKTPILAIFASESIARGCYIAYPFALQDSDWPNKNYKHVVVEGNHDLHLVKPELVAGFMVDFFNTNQC